MINLFTTAWFIQRFGVKAAMFQQTIWAAMRNLTQIYAQTIGGATGMLIITSTQLFNLMGSAGGIQLCANSYVSLLSTDDRRTANFGVVQGMSMLGAGVGYTAGGLADKYIGYLAPFQCAFFLLCFCTVFGMLFLPYIAPQEKSDSESESKKPSGFFAPIKVFAPRRVTVGGRTRRDWNLFFLGTGTFCSVLATGYVSMALQLVATNVFGFTPDTSGIMLSLNLFVRAFFLSVCFPGIISAGRRWLSTSTSVPTSPVLQQHPEDPNEAEVPDATGQPVDDSALPLTDTKHGSTFDLLFLRYSILLDSILTSAVTASSQGWHMYFAAAILPFASGTGPASKGVTLEFVSAEERPDALSAISLIEKLGACYKKSTLTLSASICNRAFRLRICFPVENTAAKLGVHGRCGCRSGSFHTPSARAHAAKTDAGGSVRFHSSQVS